MPPQQSASRQMLGKMLPAAFRDNESDAEKSEPLFHEISQDEDQTHTPLSSRSTTQPARSTRWFNGLSFGFGIILGIMGLAALQFFFNPSIPKPDYRPVTAGPDLPLEPRTFERDDLFAAPSSAESDQAWGSLMPPSDGFIYLNDSSTLNIPSGIKNAHGGETYDISLFHQLHCLMRIRESLFTLKVVLDKSLNTSSSTDSSSSSTTTTPPLDIDRIKSTLIDKQQDHVYHCFDYIRQALMCAGDMTMEWPRTEPDGRRFAVDGWGITHQCKNWDAITAYMKENGSWEVS